MDIEEFLDRELTDLDIGGNLSTKTKKAEDTEEKDDSEIEGISDDSALFQAVLDELKKGELENAEIVFSQLWRVFGNQKLQWNSELNDQLNELSREFLVAYDHSFNEMKQKAGQITDLITRARMSLKTGKQDIANKSFEECQKIKDSIPNSFIDEKRMIGEQIDNFSKEMILSSELENARKATTLLEQVNSLINNIKTSISMSNTVNAIADYEKCVKLFNQIPHEFFRNKNSAGMQILEIYKNLSISTEIIELQKKLGPKRFQPTPQTVSKPSMQIPTRPKVVNKPRPRILSQLKSLSTHKGDKLDSLKNTDKKELVEDLKQEKSDKNSAGDETSKEEWKELDEINDIDVKTKSKSKKLVFKKSKFKKSDSAQNQDLKKNIENAKKNIKRGLLDEAWKDTDEALKLAPNDVESKVLRAKIKTMQLS